MNILSGIVTALKVARKVTEMAGLCKNCHRRMPDPACVPACGTCDTILCSPCYEWMYESLRDYNRRVEKANTSDRRTDILICPACTYRWGLAKKGTLTSGNKQP